ncbi:hypothetical protein ORIO_21805 (plasmid) [Cereibacter azotoformans]|uniref:hypothetical protein n=1 Tax=Cereibacter azotoformans TaxID=43057 RepID=UPI001EEBC77C|nr:hypothetical protein [Cereibacter azotoformans]ULB12423.1 hypothetical protein ORIO_21805 [Cereibacter azotoformans]
MTHPDPRPRDAQGCRKGRLLSDCDFDDVERHTLTLMRHLLVAMVQNRPQDAPDVAMLALGRLGPVNGDRALAALMGFVQTMALGRRDPFHYANPFCPGCAARITPDEERLLRVLHHVRRGQEGRAIVHALMLCDAQPVGPLIEAAHDVQRAAEPARFA